MRPQKYELEVWVNWEGAFQYMPTISTDDKKELKDAIKEAKQNGITCYRVTTRVFEEQ